MKTNHSFTRQDDESLIIIPCMIDKDPFTVAVDTGASRTVMDLTPLLMSGYEMKNALRKVPLEAASGIIEAYIFQVKSFSSLGITHTNMEVCAYDFYAHHVLAEFDGVLGLNFFQEHTFCINLKKQIISVQ
jgi:predicted aspartyl protease